MFGKDWLLSLPAPAEDKGTSVADMYMEFVRRRTVEQELPSGCACERPAQCVLQRRLVEFPNMLVVQVREVKMFIIRCLL